MACEMIEQQRKQEALEKARKAILTGAATLERNPLTGKVSLKGFSQSDRGGMSDACIIAGVAKLAATNPALSAAYTRAGINPAAAIKAHDHAHAHGHAH